MKYCVAWQVEGFHKAPMHRVFDSREHAEAWLASILFGVSCAKTTLAFEPRVSRCGA